MSGLYVEPTVVLRFVKRDGKFILQQKWLLRETLDGPVVRREWRDVPLEEETQ